MANRSLFFVVNRNPFFANIIQHGIDKGVSEVIQSEGFLRIDLFQ